LPTTPIADDEEVDDSDDDNMAVIVGFRFQNPNGGKQFQVKWWQRGKKTWDPA
jgi:hypothetical protein